MKHYYNVCVCLFCSLKRCYQETYISQKITLCIEIGSKICIYVEIYIYVHTYTNRSVPYFTFFFGLQNSFTFVLRFFLLLLKICIKLIRITFLHKVHGKVQIISRYLTLQWWAQAGIFWEEMNWKISKNVLNWPFILISTKYLLFCYYYSMHLEKEYVTTNYSSNGTTGYLILKWHLWIGSNG